MCGWPRTSLSIGRSAVVSKSRLFGSQTLLSLLADCQSAFSIHRVSRLQRKRRDLDIELAPVRAHHLIRTVHHPHGSLKRAPRRVFERFARRQYGLLADHPRTRNFFDVVQRIGNDPVAAQKLHGRRPLIRNCTVYWNTHSSCSGREFSAEYLDRTSTRISWVKASDMGAVTEL